MRGRDGRKGCLLRFLTSLSAHVCERIRQCSMIPSALWISPVAVYFCCCFFALLAGCPRWCFACLLQLCIEEHTGTADKTTRSRVKNPGGYLLGSAYLYLATECERIKLEWKNEGLRLPLSVFSVLVTRLSAGVAGVCNVCVGACSWGMSELPPRWGPPYHNIHVLVCHLP